MAMSPSSLLAKLDELKRWQQLQQERLLKQHQSRLEAANSLFPHFNLTEDLGFSQLNINEKVVPKFSSTANVVNFGDNKEVEKKELSPKNVIKRPFLKRGAGLVKYGLQYGDQKKPFNKMKTPKVYKTVFHKRISQIQSDESATKGLSKCKEMQEVKVPVTQQAMEEPPPVISILKNTSNSPNEQSVANSRSMNTPPAVITPLKVPEIAIKPKAKWCPVLQDDYEPSIIPSTVPPGSLQGISHISECKLDAHEAFEDANQDARENIQIQMLQNNPALYEALQKLVAEHFTYPGGMGTSILDQTDLLNKLTQLENESTVYQTPGNNNNTQLVKYLNDLIRRHENNTPGDLTSYENALEKELRVFEQLEEKAMSSSFCSTNSSVMELLASTPHQVIKSRAPTFDTIQEVCNNQKFGTAGISGGNSEQNKVISRVSTAAQSSFTEVDNSVHSRNSSNAKKMLIYPTDFYTNNESSTQVDFSDESSINSGDFERTNVRNLTPERIVRQNASTMTDPIDKINEAVLKVKLQELESEISSFRTENKKIEKLKSDLDKERMELNRSKKALEKEYQSKLEDLEFEVEEQRKKINKEKFVLEKHTKEIRNKPNRKEREEISNLKTELANVKETLKIKETRNGTTQARLRTQLKSMEKDNAHLKEEIEKLQKINARLQNQTQIGRRGRQDETKMLHEINKNLTKLTQDPKVAKALTKLENSIEEKQSSEDSLNNITAPRARQQNKKTVQVERENKSKKSKKMSQKVETDESVASEEDIGMQSKKDHVISISEESEDSSSHYQERSSKKPKRRSNDYETEYRRSYSRLSYKSNSEDEERSRSKSRCRSRTSDTRKTTENKENESSNGDITTFRNLNDLSVSENYEKVFGAKSSLKNLDSSEGRHLKRHNSLNDTQPTTNKVETVLADGSRETKYPNGNVKTVSPDGQVIKMEYFNGDIKETCLLKGDIKYFYKETQIWQTTFGSGDETFEFPDGQIEKHFGDGSSHIQFPNGIVKQLSADGNEQINYPDGTVVNIKQCGEKILLLPNGQKEIHTDKHKRREYPDGTVKIIYTDGLQETRYSNGRIRMKDKEGNLIMDSHQD